MMVMITRDGQKEEVAISGRRGQLAVRTALDTNWAIIIIIIVINILIFIIIVTGPAFRHVKITKFFFWPEKKPILIPLSMLSSSTKKNVMCG